MKKMFLVPMLICMVFSYIAKVHAEDTNTTKAIFKIQSYGYDKLSDMYVLEQYGSAVLVAENILLTNAHVITDNNNNLTLQYEACQTISDQKPPKCFSTLQLLKYDKDADLALLQIVNPTSDMPAPVTIGGGTLDVGAAIRIIGYPANGGETITTTQGTIAGFENDYYKTDANVDEGNSGGGAFDGAGAFIGIPTFVIKGQTTLGYIIPTKTIKEFIAGEFGTTYKAKYAMAFDKRLKSIYALQTEGVINNTLFTTPSFSGLGLQLSSIIEKKNNNLYRYYLYNDNDNTIELSSLIATDNSAITKYITTTMKRLTDNDLSPKKMTKRIGTMNRTIISFEDTDRIGYAYIQTSSTNKTYLEFTVLVDKEDIESDLADMIQFVEDTIIKKTSGKAEVLSFPNIKLSSKRDIGIVKYLQENGLSINIFPNNGKYVAEISAYVGEKGDTLKTVTSQLRDIYDSVGYTVAIENSKFPSSVSITSVTDDNDKISLSILGVKKFGTSTTFIHITAKLTTSSAKQDAITLAYKIFGLQ